MLLLLFPIDIGIGIGIDIDIDTGGTAMAGCDLIGMEEEEGMDMAGCG